jgi:hypothetical protein
LPPKSNSIGSPAGPIIWGLLAWWREEREAIYLCRKLPSRLDYEHLDGVQFPAIPERDTDVDGEDQAPRTRSFGLAASDGSHGSGENDARR